MNPSSNEGLQLPAPVSNEQLPPAVTSEADQKTPEQAAASPEQRVGAAQAAVAAVPMIPLLGQQDDAAAGSQTDVAGTSQAATPVMADDNDLIEKEWVNKAKQIVERTRDDPYQQSEQLTAVKADYMKKRYNKTIRAIKLEK